MWSIHEQDRFFEAMWSEGRAVYLLDDNAGITNVRRALETRYTLHRVDVLDVPLFSGVDGTAGMLWEITLTNDQ
jgi:hypothetical protein